MSLTEDDYKTAIERLDHRIGGLRMQRQALLDQWAENVCPVRVGDEIAITWPSDRGKRGRVRGVAGRKAAWFTKLQYEVSVVLLRKYGTETRRVIVLPQKAFERQ